MPLLLLRSHVSVLMRQSLCHRRLRSAAGKVRHSLATNVMQQEGIIL